MVSARRRIGPRRGALAAFVTTSLALHAGAMLLVSSLGGDASSGDAKAAAAEEPSREEACEIGAVLAAGARSGLCAAPLAQSRLECARDPLRALELDLIQCRGMAGPERFLEAEEDAQVALVDPENMPPAEAREPAEEEAESEPPIERKGQIVELTEPEESERPDEARYLSEYDQSVDRETVARGSKEEMVERPSDSESDQEAQRAERAVEAGESGPGSADDKGEGEGEARELAMREARPEPPGAAGDFDLDALGEGGEVALPGEGRRDPTQDPESPETAGGERGGAPELRPSEELLARSMEGGGSVDYLEGVEEGESTALNAAQFKHAAFFNRLKREVAQHWNPARVYRRHDPEGSRYGLRDRVTVLRVYLEPGGSLARAAVIRSSGIEALDDEAVRAFRKAQPFPNPPEELADSKSDQIAFSFGFHFQVGGGAKGLFRGR